MVFVFAVSKRRVVLASTVATRLRWVLVADMPKIKSNPLLRGSSHPLGSYQIW